MLSRISAKALLAILLCHAVGTAAPPITSLKLHASRAPENGSLVRLLPTAPELTDGNAVVAMLRLAWRKKQPGPRPLAEILRESKTNPEALKTVQFDSYFRQLRRAAFMRQADWQYPLRSQPLAMISLPDLPGLRELTESGMSLWIRQQLTAGNLHAAREGILVQLACARHLARPPILIHHLVAARVADAALSELEALLQQQGAPNLYWALAMLPPTLGDHRAMLEWDAQMIEGSLPTLRRGIPAETDTAAWKQIASEFSELMVLQMGKTLSAGEAATLRGKLLRAAKRFLQRKQGFNDSQLKLMSDEAIVMRWVLATNARVHAQIQTAYALRPPQAIARLRNIETSIADLVKRTGTPALPFPAKPAATYVALNRFSRRVALLQVVESIRDHAGRHQKLPASLDELSLPAPTDPLTGKAFRYSTKDGTARLQALPVPGMPESARVQRTLVLKLATKS